MTLKTQTERHMQEPVRSPLIQVRHGTMTNQDPDDGAYPSSQSDDDGIEALAINRQSRPLLAYEDQAAGQSDAFTDRDIPASTAPLTGRRRTPLSWTEVIWVSLTLLLIAVLGYSSQLYVMLPYYEKTPSFSPQALAAVLVPFNLGLLAIYYNYWLCVTTDAGSVPAGWQPEWSALEPVASLAELEHLHLVAEEEPSLELKQAIYRPRYCKTCSAFKPPRSHHCKTCQRCVLRMDHHCPWLANCVGHFNHAHFIRFLFYVDVTCLYHLIMISCRVLDSFNSYTYWREPCARELVWLVVNYALCIPVILLVGIFSLYHFYCLAVNQTTIESWEKDRTATMIRRGRVRKVKYPYDLGLWRNVRQVLGASPLVWCLPGAGARMAGDGLKYPVANGLGKSSRAWGSFRSHKSRHWMLQTMLQDSHVALGERQQCTDSLTYSVDVHDQESYVDPELEASVMHRLRWENWHRQQARLRYHAAHAAHAAH